MCHVVSCKDTMSIPNGASSDHESYDGDDVMRDGEALN